MDLGRWKNLSARDQLGNIAAEILRAKSMKNKDLNVYSQMIERAMSLVDASLNDPKWQKNPLALLILRDELSNAYIDDKADLEKIYMAL